MPVAIYPHIEVNEAGTPVVSGTTTKVVEIVLDRLAHHWDAEEIQRQHSHLTLAQIYSALAFYYDHQNAIDQDIADRLERVSELAAKQRTSLIRQKLQLEGKNS